MPLLVRKMMKAQTKWITLARAMGMSAIAASLVWAGFAGFHLARIRAEPVRERPSAVFGGTRERRVSLPSRVTKLSRYPFRLALSRHGEMACVWVREYAHRPALWAVLDSRGEVLEASDSRVLPSQPVAAAFPELLQCLWIRPPPEPRLAVALAGGSPTSLFVGSEWSQSEVSSGASGTCRVARYTPPETREPDWSVDLTAAGDTGFLALVPGDKPLLVVGFHGTRADILDARSGRLEGTLTYGPPESDEDGLRRKKRFGLRYPDGDPSLKFWGGVLRWIGGTTLLLRVRPPPTDASESSRCGPLTACWPN